MARFKDELSTVEAAAMRKLFVQLKLLRPFGWPVVQGTRELILRPSDRELGKFSITVSPAQNGLKFCLCFFSRSINYWDGSTYFDQTEDIANDMLNWALRELRVEQTRCDNNSI
jgi:hypothetical protein